MSAGQGETTSVFSDWLVRISQEPPPPDGIIAFNLGIFESSAGFTIYLTGSKEFDPEDDDWACREDYSPKERYFELPPEFVNGKDWESVQAELTGIFRQILTENTDTILSRAEFVTVGFDEGTLTRMR